MRSYDEILAALRHWNNAWDAHDLDAVMELFHDEIYFENWTGAHVQGKAALRKAWSSWFEDHGNFRFIAEDTFVDETQQKVLYRWELHWPSTASGFGGKAEIRRGVDVMHFQDGKIIKKLTYSKTSLEIAGKRIPLVVAKA